MQINKAKILKCSLAVFVIYIFIYAVLSLNGRYAPAGFDLRRIISYEWAPLGFFDKKNASQADYNLGWNFSMIRFFYPLWIADIRFLHKVSFDGKSPASLATDGQ